jgi:hypothetical protein
MSKKTKYKYSNNVPREETKLHRNLLSDDIVRDGSKLSEPPLIKGEKELPNRRMTKGGDPGIPYFTRLKNDGVIHFFVFYIIFAICILSYGVYMGTIDQKTPIVIKLKVVNNFTNYVKDDCGQMYEPIYPRLTDTITVMAKTDAEALGKGGPNIVLNESNVYNAILVSNPMMRQAHVTPQITDFKLAEDQSKYDKKC